jgi:signal transduction histidine kinase/ligand-binding sensor domain-containing protein
MTALAFRPLACFVAAALAFVARAEPTYSSRTWTTDDGLPHNTVTRALQDRAGYLWFGTPGGLARFDGREFNHVALSTEPPSFTHSIRGLTEESPGVLLVLASPNRLIRVTPGTVAPHPAAPHVEQLPDLALDLHVEPSGAVWVATSGGALLRWSGDSEIERFGLDAPVAARSKRFTFATDRDGTTWIASDSFLAAHRHGRLESHPQTPSGPMLIAPSPRGGVWIVTATQLLKLDGRGLQRQSDAVPWREDFDAMLHLLETRRGDLLLTSRHSLVQFRDGQFQSLPVPYSVVNYILEDEEENLWLATRGSGIGQVRERMHRVFDHANGLRQDGVSALAEDSTGGIWIANRTGGLQRLDAATGRSSPVAEEWSRSPADVVAVDRGGRVWFGGHRAGLWRWDPSTGQPAEHISEPTGELNALLATRSGHVRFSTLRGEIGRYQGDRLELFTTDDGYSLGSLYALAEDEDGSIWVGGRQRVLQRWKDGRFETISAEGIEGAIHALLVDRGQRLWIGTAAGLLVWEHGRMLSVTTRQGLPDDIIYSLLDDDAGHLWLATRRGLYHVFKEELLAAARGQVGRLTASRFGPEQGLRGFTPTANFHPRALKSSTGRLWFASTQGAVELDVQRIPRRSAPPPLRIDTVRWNGEPLALGTTNTLQLPSGDHRVELKMVVLSYRAPENIVLKHRLKGFDRAWIDTGSDGMAGYTNLAPGTYEFFAMARTAAGTWSEERSLLTLTIVPAWWETATFRVLSSLGLVLVVAAAVRVVSQRRLRARLLQLEQAHALERERARIARDLHDDLGASITEIGLLAERLLRVSPPELGAHAAGLAGNTRRLAAELSRIVWTVSRQNTTLDRLAKFMRQYAERVFRTSATSLVVRGVDEIPPLPLGPEPQHQLLSAVKEALNNVLKHAQATRAVLEVSFERGLLVVQLTDDGLGFERDPTAEAESNGLRNITLRMQELGGSFNLVTARGRGTTVTLRYPVPTSPTPSIPLPHADLSRDR